ncbi:unnamed protein product [Candida verbasci]|uniref:Serine/threonine-protein kinase SCH9 n=1 Tax=Candida verbasci TaxID=1227364 RepID=A0A9W4TT31_9ASCO|nr:unnamed protein product [Candida verbasci]
MADFAKSIFGLNKKSNNNSTHHSSASPTPPSSSHSNQSTTTKEQHQFNYDQQQQAQSFNQQQYDQFNDDQQNKFLPKGLVNLIPTTPVSNNSSVYGTTTTKANDNPESYLNQQFKSNDYHQNNFNHPHYYQQNINHQQLQQLQQEPNQQQSSSSTISSHYNQDPVIITTDETGQTINPDSEAATHPKGKLKVTILEAKDLQATQPYVVCSFESSEFVTNGPDSFGKFSLPQPNHNKNFLPVNKHHQNHNQRPGLYQRQLSTPQLNLTSDANNNPIWNHDALFDVIGSKSELDISVYDGAKDDAFLGHVRLFPQTTVNKKSQAEWLPLTARVIGEKVSGSILIKWEYTSLAKKNFGPDNFEFLRLLGKGTFGQVFQVIKKDTSRIYAMKVLSKKVIVKKKEIAHTIGERNILVRTSTTSSPFIVGLKFSFQTPTDLYLVTDYMSGGELFWHLQKEGRFSEDRAKFYIAELVCALEHLHDNSIVYRDLKPENILLDANGHIALCDFGLSKANLNNDGTTNTFCGTTEYLAPEVLLDESGYTKMVDFWSLGVLIFEMTCGWSPFYADNTQQMYKNIAFGKVRFPKEILSAEGRSFVKGLLNRNPKHRLGATNDARELKAHPFFNDIDWNLLKSKSIPPPFKPHLTSETDTSNFDPEFTSESTTALKKQMEMASTPLSPGIQANFKGFTYVDDSTMDDHFAKSLRMNTFKSPGSFIPGNPNLPPDEDVIDDDQIEEEDEMEIDEDHPMDYEFVNGRFDL